MGRLRRTVGIGGAIVIGLGSMVGTGVFVSLVYGMQLAGRGVILAVVVAAALAMANALSSAQLARVHPVSGGTYEYGYRELHPLAGFAAGWLFLVAKSASSATAALALATVLGTAQPTWVAVAIIAGMTAIVAAGIRRTNGVNIVLVTVTVGSLLFFVAAALRTVVAGGTIAAGVATAIDGVARGATRGVGEAAAALGWRAPGVAEPLVALASASAVIFVAFTGYGRIATLGEEIRDPGRNIPRAAIATVLIVAALYLAVALAGLAAPGATALVASFEAGRSPLVDGAEILAGSTGRIVLQVGAATAMAGVLLNLVLGLSRVVLAMARRGDMPGALAHVGDRGPTAAVLVVGGAIAALAAIGDVRVTWGLSAVTVLLYYGLTNAAALRLKRRLFPRWVSAAGLAGCVVLAPFVEARALAIAAALLAVGALWRAGLALIARR